MNKQIKKRIIYLSIPLTPLLLGVLVLFYLNEGVPGLVGIAALFFTAIGLFLNAYNIDENDKTRQLQLITDSSNELNKNELLFYTDFKQKDEEGIKEWASLYFNSIELLAFFINEKYIKDKKLAGFFDDSVSVWYKMFEEHHTKEEVNDDSLYPEFKKLHKRIKEEDAEEDT